MENDRETEVPERAYALWEERGRPPGSSDQDWLRAEREPRVAAGPSTAPRRPRAGKALAGDKPSSKTPQGAGEGARPPRGA